MSGYSRGWGRSTFAGGGSSYHRKRSASQPSAWVETDAPLFHWLQRQHGAPYGILKQLTSETFWLSQKGVHLLFHHVQSDPFAPGSEVCVDCPTLVTSGLLHTSPDLFCLEKEDSQHLVGVSSNHQDASHSHDIRRIAMEDYLLRSLLAALDAAGNSGAIEVLRPSQHVLERAALRLYAPPPDSLNSQVSDGLRAKVFLRVKLPGAGRRIDGHQIANILFGELLPALERGISEGCSIAALQQHADGIEDQEWLRQQLPPAGLVAFVANGAILPREGGNMDTPMPAARAVPFESPKHLSRSFTLPRQQKRIEGMGIPVGVTLITGGGFHGKSTLLRALEVGVYNHVPRDGRECVVVNPTAVKIRAEDRRSIQNVNISPFINNLPLDTSSSAFSTSDASGSTSQAANMIEAMELGSRLLLFDEDTCASNLMYRDQLMRELIPSALEPITPLLDRVTAMQQDLGVSSILVVGGSGMYFPYATTILMLNQFCMTDVTAQAHAIAAAAVANSNTPASANCEGPLPSDRSTTPNPFAEFRERAITHRHIDQPSTLHALWLAEGKANGDRRLKVGVQGRESIRLGANHLLDLRHVEQLCEEGQTRAIAMCIAYFLDSHPERCGQLQRPVAVRKESQLSSALSPGIVSLSQHMVEQLRTSSLQLTSASNYNPRGFASLPRRYEIAAAFNRLRCLKIMKL